MLIYESMTQLPKNTIIISYNRKYLLPTTLISLMIRRFSVNFAIFSMSVDAVIISIALFIAELIRPSLSKLSFAAQFPSVVHAPIYIYLIFCLEWISVFLLFSIYDGRHNFRFIDELTNLTIASIIAMIIMAGTLYLSYREISRLLFLTFTAIAYACLVGWRVISRYIILPKVTSKSIQNTIIIGTSKLGIDIYSKLSKNPSTTLNIIGFIDNNPQKQTNIEILGTIKDTPEIIQQQKISNVIIALPIDEQAEVKNLINELQTFAIQIYITPEYIQLALYDTRVENLEGIPLLDLRASSLNDYERMVKRIIDLVITILILPFALPIMILIGLIIWIDDGLPILYLQKRVGENGKIFTMVKFRTMQEQKKNENSSNPDNHPYATIYKLPNDPRITKVGKILRHFSLDELPQLFNVLKGEMSLVGPRPEIPALVEKYELWQRARFTVPQGITGWWQINGRSEKPMHLNTEYDMYYIQNYSIWLDLYILLKTIPVVISGKGAF